MPELRFDLPLGAYSIIATERAKRPSDFKAAQKDGVAVVEFDPGCPFCPGNEDKTPPEVFAVRESGPKDSPGWSVRVVPNKFPALTDPTTLSAESLTGALRELTGEARIDPESMYWQAPAIGGHEVVIESPSHGGSLGTYGPEHLFTVLQVIQGRIRAMAARPGVKYVQVFRNYGSRAGASLSHPHFQIMALPVIPPAIENEMRRCEDYANETGRCLMCDIVEREVEKGTRVVSVDESFAVIAPFASRYSFETIIVPRRHAPAFSEAPREELAECARTVVQLFSRYESLFADLPYNLVIHSAPNVRRTTAVPKYHWHIHTYPRLNSEAGLELGTGVYINPTPPESATSDLRGAK